jgi:hypothetical protein
MMKSPLKISAKRNAELEFFAHSLKHTRSEILEFTEFYNRDFSLYDNSIYEHSGSRVVHWWNYEDHDWFASRIDKCLNFVEALLDAKKNVLFVDVGFSVPYTFTRPSLCHSPHLWSILIDKEPSAKDFYETLANFLFESQPLNNSISVLDVELAAHRQAISQKIEAAVKVSQISDIVIMASEVIEHLVDPESFWSLVDAIKSLGIAKIHIYITLPICKKIPSHTMEFLRSQDALSYVRARMQVNREWLLSSPDDNIPTIGKFSCYCALSEST